MSGDDLSLFIPCPTTFFTLFLFIPSCFLFYPFSIEKILFWKPLMENTFTAFQILSQIIAAFCTHINAWCYNLCQLVSRRDAMLQWTRNTKVQREKDKYTTLWSMQRVIPDEGSIDKGLPPTNAHTLSPCKSFLISQMSKNTPRQNLKRCWHTDCLWRDIKLLRSRDPSSLHTDHVFSRGRETTSGGNTLPALLALVAQITGSKQQWKK